MNDDTETPVALEIIGAVDKVKQVFGVPVSSPLELTTYKEAQEMVEELYGEGLSNMSVKLSGWMNGGVQQKMLDSVNLISDLGSKKDLQNMIDSAEEKALPFISMALQIMRWTVVSRMDSLFIQMQRNL